MSLEITSSGRQVGWGQIGLGLAVAGACLIGVRLVRGRKRAQADGEPAGSQAVATAARRLNRAAGVLAFSVLADSAIEHYRASFHNRAMYTPLLVSGLTMAISLHGLRDASGKAHPVRDTIYVVAALTGAAGVGFHAYNVAKRPGRLDWQNLFYGAPLGAPAAIALAGLLGAAAERVRDAPPLGRPRILGLPAGRAIAAVTSLGLVGTVGEVGLLHFRGAYHDPFMYLPIGLPPVAAALLANAALGAAGRGHGLAEWWLRATAAMGFAGVGFHAYGVQRNMGGWANWRKNLLDGPPLPAPPSFTGLALAGLAALDLLRNDSHA